jgi:hypothetical protein
MADIVAAFGETFCLLIRSTSKLKVESASSMGVRVVGWLHDNSAISSLA